MTCTASGTAQAGQYANVGTVTATTRTRSDRRLGPEPLLRAGPGPRLRRRPRPQLPDHLRLQRRTAPARLGRLPRQLCRLRARRPADSDAPTATTAAAGISTFGTCAVAGRRRGRRYVAARAVHGPDGQRRRRRQCPLYALGLDRLEPGRRLGRPRRGPLPRRRGPRGGQQLADRVASPQARLAGATAARFRCTTDGAVTPVGRGVRRRGRGLPGDGGEPVPAGLSATKSAALTDDVDSDGIAGAGDTLTYTVVIANSGNLDATGVTYADTPDPATALLNGSVTTTLGTVTSGNSGATRRSRSTSGSSPAGQRHHHLRRRARGSAAARGSAGGQPGRRVADERGPREHR